MMRVRPNLIGEIKKVGAYLSGVLDSAKNGGHRGKFDPLTKAIALDYGGQPLVSGRMSLLGLEPENKALAERLGSHGYSAEHEGRHAYQYADGPGVLRGMENPDLYIQTPEADFRKLRLLDEADPLGKGGYDRLKSWEYASDPKEIDADAGAMTKLFDWFSQLGNQRVLFPEDELYKLALQQAIGGRGNYLEHLKYLPTQKPRVQGQSVEQMRLPL